MTTNYRAPVATAYAAPLVASSDTCMGSTSIGGQAAGFGVSVGTTWTDRNCIRLKNSRELAALGFRSSAVQLLCIDDDVALAMSRAGTPCTSQIDPPYAPPARAAYAEPRQEYTPPPPPRPYYAVPGRDRPPVIPEYGEKG